MSELMKKSLHLAQCQEGRFLVRRLCQIHHHADMGTHIVSFVVDPLALKLRHPRASLFAFSGMEIGIKNRQITPIMVKHFVSFHVGMVNRDVLVFPESDSIEFLGQPKDTIYHLVQLEIGAQHFSVKIVFLHLQLVRIVAEVPRPQFEVLTLQSPCQPFYLRHFFFGCRLVGVYQVVEQLVDITNIGCHAMFQHVVGIGFESQQLGHLPAQVHQSLADGQVVFAVIVNALGILCHVEFFPQRAVFGIGHERGIARKVKREHPALLSLLFRSQSCRLFRRFGQAFQPILVCYVQFVGFVFFQQVLRKLQRQYAGFFCQLPQLLFVSLVQQCTTPDKTVIACFEQHLLFRSQCPMVLIYIFNTCEQLFIQTDVVGMFGKNRTHFLGQRIQLVVGLRTQHAREYVRHPIQQVIIMLSFRRVDPNDSVLKRRCFRIVDDLLYLFIIAPDTFHESFFVIFGMYLAKRDGVVWSVVGYKKRIDSFTILYTLLIHTMLTSYIIGANL